MGETSPVEGYAADGVSWRCQRLSSAGRGTLGGMPSNLHDVAYQTEASGTIGIGTELVRLLLPTWIFPLFMRKHVQVAFNLWLALLGYIG